MLYIQTTDDAYSIEPYENLNRGNVLPLSIIDRYKESAIFITKDEMKDFLTIGTSENNDIVCIDDFNVYYFATKQLKNVYLFVDNEEYLYRNYLFICNNVSGVIEIKIKPSYNKEVLEKELKKIAQHLLHHDVIVKNLTGWNFTDKFAKFGDGDYFLAPDSNVYYHPAFYYTKSSYGKISSIDSFIETEDIIIPTRPHLLCLTCEAFYCDRNIYLNKMATSEYKVPSRATCELTSLFHKYSLQIFNTRYNQDREWEHLDKVESFNSETFYKKLDSVFSNQVKELDFNNRKLYEVRF